MTKHLPPKLKKLSSAKQRRLGELLEKNSEGQISPKDKATLRRLVAEAEQLMVDNAKTLGEFSDREAVDAPEGAVPVTVWVKAEHPWR